MTLGAVLNNRTPNDLADLMTDLLPSELLIVFRRLPRKVAVDTFQYLLPSVQERLLKAITPEEAAGILNAMSPDDRTMLLEKLPDLAGSMLPFALRRLGFDPATSSAPFVATLVDVTGLIIYFSIAAVILRDSLLR